LADYKRMYHKMFNAVTDAEQLASQATRILRGAQLECEEMYTDADDTPISLMDKPER